MIDSAILLEELIKRANLESNEKILNKLNNKNFIKSFDEITEILSDLGFHLENNDKKIDDQQNEIYHKIANALTCNFFTTYYVNINTGLYVGYSSNNDYKVLKIEESGIDFFSDASKNIPSTIYKDDQEKINEIINKKFLNDATKDGNIYKINYRIILNDIPTYISLSAIRITSDDLIIGLSNIDEATKKEIKLKNTIQENLTYTNIALALCKNYFAVYYVNIENDKYEQYKVDNQTQIIEKIEEGDDFFHVSTINAKKYIHKEDLDRFLYVLNKKNMLGELKSNNSIYLEYRQLIKGIPTYVSLNIVNLTNDNNHIVLAVSNVDKQKKKEYEIRKSYEQERLFARTDSLTGTYNKNYYLEVLDDANHKIKNKTLNEFSVIVCDINNLKIINDTLGHDAGDEYIIEASKILKSVFLESLIFRTGGDEFIIILERDEYKNRYKLLSKLNEKILKNKKENKVPFACGYSDFDLLNDNSVSDVEKRADILMYENKKCIKEK